MAEKTVLGTITVPITHIGNPLGPLIPFPIISYPAMSPWSSPDVPASALDGSGL